MDTSVWSLAFRRDVPSPAAETRELTRAIAPIIPDSANKLMMLIDAGEGGTPIPQPTPLFPRLELLDDEEEAAA